MKTFSGVHTIELHNCRARLVSRRRLKFWLNLRHDVTIEEMEPDSGEPSAKQEKAILRISNATVTICVPFGRSTNIYATGGSAVTGRCVAGNLRVDQSSSTEIDVPFRIQRSFGPVASMAVAVAEDLAYIALGVLPIATVGAIVLPLFEIKAIDHIGLFTVISAGAYVGIRGASKRALLTSMTLAALITFGPEVGVILRDGMKEAFKEFDWEDLGKALVYLATFGLGSAIRKYYERKAY